MNRETGAAVLVGILALGVWLAGGDVGTVGGRVAQPPARPPTPPAPIPTGAGYSAATVTAARNDLGVKEDGGDNRGARIEAMLASVGTAPGQPWCAAAVSTWLAETAKALGVARPIAGSAGVRELVAQMKDTSNARVAWFDASELRSSPGLVRPGMLAMWSKSPTGGDFGHVGIVTSAAGAGGTFATVEGNAGVGSDSVVTATHALSSTKLLGMGRFDDAAIAARIA